ncbi:MAG: MgtC/SapB family protein [Alphaproteobacteria bacterium]
MYDELLSTTNMDLPTIALRLVLAAVLAGLIGLEREWRGKPAGLRTYTLVGLGAAGFFLLTMEFMLGPMNEREDLALDPTRIFEGVITGIGFLGAGAIIQGQRDVKGLTTGAGIWVAGAVGLACGGGYFLLAGFIAVLALVVLFFLGLIEHHYIDPS